MTSTRASAPGKVILFGEHAVVYGRPAIAAPVIEVRATAIVEDETFQGVRLKALDLRREYWLREARENDPFARAVNLVAESSGRKQLSGLTITFQSTIPMASGLGSGAAMAAAVTRALALHMGLEKLATNEQVSVLTYEVEQLLHGTPSGIDNTVVVFQQPVFFKRQQPQNQIETLSVGAPVHLLIADTGVPSKTKSVVGDVRRLWQEDPEGLEAIFDGCGRIAQNARLALEDGQINRLGQLMSENQNYLREMTVSSPDIEHLIKVALEAGALGAKLSGAGRGGNIIVLVTKDDQFNVREALKMAGARIVISSVLN